MAGVNMPGALALGDLKSTSLVTIGRGAAISVDNSGTDSAGAVSFAGPLTVSGGIDLGTNPLTCGALSSSSITASGSLTCGAVAAAGNLVCGAAACGAVTLSGNLTCGTAAMSCGAVSCSSSTSSGPSTSQRWWARLVATADQAVATSTDTDVVFQALETDGGSSVNFPTSLPQSVCTIPQSGMYLLTYSAVFAASDANQRFAWFNANGAARRWAADSSDGAAGTTMARAGAVMFQFEAGDTVKLQVWQNSGGSLNLSGTGDERTAIEITRLSE